MKKPEKKHGLFGATVSALLAIGFFLLFAVAALRLAKPLDMDGLSLALFALLALASAIGAAVALVERWREVRRGEEDEAGKY